jgi:hypothetical protein
MNIPPQNRRDFLRLAGRTVVLGGIGALGASLFRREGLTDACINNEICVNCRRHGNCELPAATIYREGQEKGDYNG